MRNIEPKVFWSFFSALSFVLGALLLMIVGALVAFVFFISLIIGVVIFYPFLPHMPVVQDFFLREYEFECNILRVMEFARFDASRKFGWMSPSEILSAVKEISDRRISLSAIYVSLQKLKKEGAVTSGQVPVHYLKNPPERAKEAGTCLAFRLEHNSTYKPRKPKWLLEKQTKELNVVDDGVHVH